ncbi:hypothetical protein BRADI_1g61825v3 [Brachypodium distachyon]|uniref:Uncharacterized protein n=1 Tax=Brachypodium distachyon TaxID=15368 RepID=A0A2K2DSX3_BRADI|nr:hypothetical protein BRADI_1g61825v3 [Brachypodium distachyon]
MPQQLTLLSITDTHGLLKTTDTNSLHQVETIVNQKFQTHPNQDCIMLVNPTQDQTVIFLKPIPKLEADWKT